MKREKKVKYALVLSGGGFNGAFQLGALNYINDNWKEITGLSSKMKFDLIAGVSIGAIDGAMVAMNQLGTLNELWLDKIAKNGVSEIYTSDFIDTDHKGDELKLKLDIEGIGKRFLPNFKMKFGLLDKLGMLLSKKKRKKVIAKMLKNLSGEIKKSFPKFNAIADNSPLKEKLFRYLDRSKIVDTKFMCGFVSLDNGMYQSVLHSDFGMNEDFVNGVLSSACIPIIWKPIKAVQYWEGDNMKFGKNLIDGGVNNVSPLGDVVKQINSDPEDCEYKIIIINCHSGVQIPKDFSNANIGQIAARSLYDIAFTEIFNNDIKHFMKINDLVKQAKEWDDNIVLFDSGTKAIKEFDTVVIQPDPEMDLGNGLVANQKLVNLRLIHGKEMARKGLKAV